MKDPDIRGLLKGTALRSYLTDPNSKVVEEFRLSPARAQVDIAVINGAMHAFEIKSAADTLRRLPNQVDCYTKIFDFVSVVTEQKYLTHVNELVPEWVGIYLCTDPEKLDLIRKPSRNLSIEGFYIAQLLWRDEIKDLLQHLQISYKSHLRNWLLCELLASNVPAREISEHVRTKLKSRAGWKLIC